MFAIICRSRRFFLIDLPASHVYHRSRTVTPERPGKTIWRFRSTHDLFTETIFRCRIVNNLLVLVVTPNTVWKHAFRMFSSIRVRNCPECWFTQNIFTASAYLDLDGRGIVEQRVRVIDLPFGGIEPDRIESKVESIATLMSSHTFFPNWTEFKC